jgi:hypothetical protein
MILEAGSSRSGNWPIQYDEGCFLAGGWPLSHWVLTWSRQKLLSGLFHKEVCYLLFIAVTKSLTAIT